MDYRKLQNMLEDVLTGMYDYCFDEVMAKIHCMSRPRVYAVLNSIVACMEPGELYVEVGTYQGGSLISALLHNDARAIGVDSFGEFNTTNSYEKTIANLQAFGVAERVDFKNMDFRQFFTECDPALRIQVYYYDGAHDYETQLAGMESAWDHLSPGSIILVDDYTYSEVSRAINQFIANHIQNLKFQFIMLPEDGLDEKWWNGCVVMRVI